MNQKLYDFCKHMQRLLSCLMIITSVDAKSLIEREVVYHMGGTVIV